MNILLITDSYPPEVRSASHLMQELARELLHRDHAVTVVTTSPEYNLAEQDRNTVYPELCEEDGVRVVRIKTLPHHNVPFVLRGLSQLSLPLFFQRAIRRHIHGSLTAVVVYSPPLPLALVGGWVKRRYRCRYVLNVQDIFPQNAVDLGVLKNPLLIRFFEAMERRAYRQADTVTVHSDGNREFLLSRNRLGAPALRILHNWIDVDEYAAARSTGRYRQAWGLENRILVLFAGVLGPSQGLDGVLDVAARALEHPEVCFLFVGDGMMKESLQKRAAAEKLTNVVFKPFVAKQQYPELVKECDIGLVSLTSRNKTPVVPNKILGYMAAGIPVLAYLNAESDGHALAAASGGGISAVSADTDACYAALTALLAQAENLPVMGRNGCRYVREHFSRNACVDALEGYLEE